MLVDVMKQIPQEFLKHISKESSDKASLTVQGSVRSWTVKLSETGIGVFLQDGWLKFLRDNSLGDSEFLLFTYDGNMCFSVQIFNKNGCERIVAASDQIRRNQEFDGFGFANGMMLGTSILNSITLLHVIKDLKFKSYLINWNHPHAAFSQEQVKTFQVRNPISLNLCGKRRT